MYSPCRDRRGVGGATVAGVAAVLALLAGCEREMRRFQVPPSPAEADVARQGELKPGPPAGAASGAASAAASLASQASAASMPARSTAPDQTNPFEENAYAVSQGKRLFRWYNCNGCHGSGGGGMGPALMDAEWIYGGEPAQIAATILQGRPNGMPSFAGRIPEDQVWQIAAYVRSMSGQLQTDVAPGRSDSISPAEPEQRREMEGPVTVGPGSPR
jgi:cytochrome c oxidase cbb3-type subunit 3